MKFELDSLPRNCSTEEIIAEIKRVDALVNKTTLTIGDYDRYGKIHSSTLRHRFGDWQKVLTLAGIGDKFTGRKEFRGKMAQKLTDDEIICELKRIAKLLNKESITTEDVRNHSQIMWESVVTRRFGSWAAGLEKAGLKISPLGHRYSLDDYFENLLNVWTHYGRQPSYGEIDKAPSKISAGAYENRFGTWRKALEAFVTRMNKEEPAPKYDIRKELATDQKHVIGKPKKIKIRILSEDKRGIGLSLRYKVLNRDKFKCVKCGASPATDHSCKLHVDHRIPFSRGGKTALDNLQTLCQNCNLGKGAEANL